MPTKLHMQKEATQKEDGRYLIYYHFTSKACSSESGCSKAVPGGRGEDVRDAL